MLTLALWWPQLLCVRQEVFQTIELVSVIIFSIEYIIRFATCPCENRGAIHFVLVCRRRGHTRAVGLLRLPSNARNMHARARPSIGV